MLTILLAMLIGMYLGSGIVIGSLWVMFSVLGNEWWNVVFGLTGPLTWPIMVYIIYLK